MRLPTVRASTVRCAKGPLRGGFRARVPSVPRCAGAAGTGGGGGSGNGPHRRMLTGRGGDDNEPSRPSRKSSHGSKFAALSAVSCGLQLVSVGSAHAKKQDDDASIEEMAGNLSSLAMPVLTNLGFSGVIGAIAGITLKKVGQLFAVALGLCFCVLQGLAYLGFIDLKWQKIHRVVEKHCDINKDGKLDELDLQKAAGVGLGILAEGVPSVGGFLGGFALGVKMG